MSKHILAAKTSLKPTTLQSNGTMNNRTVALAALGISNTLDHIRPASDKCMILEPPSPYLVTGSGSIQILGIGGSTVRLTYLDVEVSQKTTENKTGDQEQPIPAYSITHSEVFSKQIPIEAKEGDFIAYAVSQVKPHLKPKTPIAVSMSFPMRDGRIIALGKQFNPVLIGTDVVEHVNKLVQPDFEAVSVTHDGVASLIAGIHADKKCVLALTLGTGVNITALKSEQFLNTEIGYLGNYWILPFSYLPKTQFDEKKNAQPFESLVGGLYLGSIVSRISGQDVSTEQVLKLAYESDIDSDASLVYASKYVIGRAAILVAAALVGVAASKSIAQPEIHAVYTGGLISQPSFRNEVEHYLQTLNQRNRTIKLEPQLYGSEVGAGLQGLARIQACKTSKLDN